MARQKKFDLNNLLNEDKDYEKVTPLKLDNKNTIKYAKKFKESKIDDLMKELGETVKFAKDNGLDYPIQDEHVTEYIDFLIFKHFTELQEALVDADYYMNMQAYHNAYQRGWLTKVVIHTFDVEQVLRVHEKINAIRNNIENYENEIDKNKNRALKVLNTDFAKDKIKGLS